MTFPILLIFIFLLFPLNKSPCNSFNSLGQFKHAYDDDDDDDENFPLFYLLAY